MQSIVALTCGELESLLQVIEVCLMGLIPDEEQQCWKLHINIICLLQGQHFSDLTLVRLTLKICRWKVEMVIWQCDGEEENGRTAQRQWSHG
jgi:exosome complex RNA-binding protein Rrp42 (RNase PH superfamily)